MAGNKKHGFRRGNSSGRTKPSWKKTFYCDGCKKEHGENVFRNGINGLLLCDMQYYKLKGIACPEF